MDPSLKPAINISPLKDANRIVVKIGSALLVDEITGYIRHKWLNALADDVANLKQRGKYNIYKFYKR